MTRAPAFVLQLELDRAGDAISGRVNVGAGLVLPFSGWVGLAAALEHATSVEAACPTTSLDEERG